MSDTPRTNFVAHETGDAEWDRSMNRFGRMMAHAQTLERELAAAQKDAERYRWLRERQGPNNRWPHISQYPYCPEIDKEKVPQLWDAGYHPDKLDAAIDAATKECGK